MKKNKYYWDSVVFLKLIKDEPMSSEEKQGLLNVVREIDNEKAKLVTSVITLTEVLDAKLTQEQKERFEASLKKPFTVKVNVEEKVATLASQIRSYYHRQGKKIETPDAQHLATALLFEVDELHTYDDKLLSLNGDVMGKKLKICKPTIHQYSLAF